MKKGRCGTMTHDYKRNGTTTLFAALSVLDGKVVGQCQPRHRHQEFLKFLRLLDREFPGKRELHLILDNYGTHKTPGSASLAEEASALCSAFHTDQFQLAEPRRAMVRSVDAKSIAARNLSQRLRPAGSDSILPGCMEHRSETFRLDRQAGRHSRQRLHEHRTKLESISPVLTLPRRRQKREE